ncbi:MAG TPA: helix-turn-helix domain-containing protein [Flexivirga sp.]|uniref:helix-turn-helix domain-containing protein n=1 Tax=Flexivirga sp. TaxID=1962927 RepID=UPI002C6481C9|nr:helix-turn-helix domain-containing protein [Flexivirga sp.]HWC24318.1 helix-turn-helix domain-containing protein [Flexivirga sp.]
MSLEDDAISELRATAHPVRLRMLSLLTGAALSAAELARELDITQANASYHLRTLAKAGQVEVATTESVRGGQAKKYRYRHPEERAPGQRPRRSVRVADAEFRQYLEALHHELVRRAEHRVDGPAISSDAEVWLTPDVWRRARDLVKEASMLVHDEALRPHAPGSVHVNFQTELFPMRDERDVQDGEQGGAQ